MRTTQLTLFLLIVCQTQGKEGISMSYFNTYPWLNFALTKIAAGLDTSYQVMVFISKRSKSTPQSDIIRYISSKNPVIITDSAKI